MTKKEKQNLEALKIGFENTEWKDFLLVLNEIRDRDKETIAMYRKSHIELKELKKALAKEEKVNTPEPLYKQEPKALIIDDVSKSSNVFLVGDNVLFGHQKGKVVWTSVRYVDIKLINGKIHQGIPVVLVKHP